MHGFWKRVQRNIGVWMVLAAFRGLGLLPLGLAMGLAGLLGRLVFHLGRRRMRRAINQLAIAFPNMPEKQRLQIARDNLVHLFKAGVEVACVRQIDPQLESYMELTEASQKVLLESRAKGKGVIFATGHLGNWELLARRFGKMGLAPLVVATRGWDARLDEVVADFRRSGGVETLWREKASSGRLLLQTMREGRPLGILIDQDTKVRGVFVPFFGRPAHTPRAAADLALRFGATLLVGWSHGRTDGKRGYILEMEALPYDPAADPEAEALRITAACTARLEQVIREHPTEWFWMHRRWRTQPEAAPAPAKPAA
jgi:KDO2-lipid IV(A) lauroyltransferase